MANLNIYFLRYTMTKINSSLHTLLIQERSVEQRRRTTEIERQKMFNFVQIIKMREALILKFIKKIISINLDTKDKAKGQIIKMIDSELYEEIKIDINIEQLERQFGEFFIDSSDGDCWELLIVLVSLSSNSFWLFSSW